MHTRYLPPRRLKLTGLMRFAHGAFLLPLAGLRPWYRFELRTRVYVGDSEVFCTYDTARGGKVCGGHGFSLLYGDLRRRGLGQLGASAGLRMQFGTSGHEDLLPTLSILYDNLLVMRLPLQPRWRRHAWVALRIGYKTADSPSGLVVERDAITDCRDVAVDGFAPRASWRFAFAASNGLAADNYWLDDLTLTSEALLEATDVAVEVSLNGQQYTLDGVRFTYDAPVYVSSFSPTTGPAAGNTGVVVSGAMLQHGLVYTCRFGTVETPSSYNATTGEVVCTQSPQQPSGELPLGVSLDRINVADAQHADFGHYQYYNGSITEIFPTGGPVAGGTALLVHGVELELGSHYKCRYGNVVTAAELTGHARFREREPWCAHLDVSCRYNRSVEWGNVTPQQADFLDPTNVACITPPMTAQTLDFTVSLNAQQYAGRTRFLYYRQPAIATLCPSSGPSLGGTRVMVTGTKFIEFAGQVCQWGPDVRNLSSSATRSATVPASLVDASTIRCVAPAAADAVLAERLVMTVQNASHASLRGDAVFCTEAWCDTVPLRATGSAVVLLTAVDSQSSGAVVLPLLGPGNVDHTHFRVVFSFDVQHTCSGEIFSFDFGPPDHLVPGAEGSSGGLSILFVDKLDQPSELRLLLDGAAHLRLETPGWLLHGAAAIEITHGEMGLSVWHNERLVLRDFVLDGWAPAADWTITLGASNGRYCHCHCLAAGLEVSFGALTVPTVAAVELAVNAQQFTTNNITFVYYAPPVVSAVAPSHGPTAGGSVVVVTGSNLALGSHYACSFGGSRVPASQEGTRSDQIIFCLAPPMPQGFASVEVSLNGQQFSSSTVDYRFHALPVVRRITPPRGPPSGQTLIAVYADHLEVRSQRHLNMALTTSAVSAPTRPLSPPRTTTIWHVSSAERRGCVVGGASLWRSQPTARTSQPLGARTGSRPCHSLSALSGLRQEYLPEATP